MGVAAKGAAAKGAVVKVAAETAAVEREVVGSAGAGWVVAAKEVVAMMGGVVGR